MPLRLFHSTPHFRFMQRRWIGFAASFALTAFSCTLLITQGLNWGIDFTGGVLMEIRTEQDAKLADMRAALNVPEFGEVALQNFGDARGVIVRLQPKNTKNTEDRAQVVANAKAKLEKTVQGTIEYRRIDYVGPSVGAELKQDGALAVALAFAVIMVYVWFRFEWQYGLGAILALLHDAIMMMGFFAFTRFEFGLTAIAAVLTVVGYSINDSVVIYDRIRENMRKFKKMPVEELLNRSINETLSRTILTASTTLLASLALALFGGEVIHGFSWAMVFGVVVGTYSSIYISAPALIYLRIRPESEANAAAA